MMLTPPIKLEHIQPWTGGSSNGDSKEPPNAEINARISFLPRADLTTLAVDAIVTPANSTLTRGGGLCQRVHEVAGPELEAEATRHAPLSPGSSVVTAGYRLPAKCVIHAVGHFGFGNWGKLYESVLSHINGHQIRTVGLCCLGTGWGEENSKLMAQRALKIVRKFLTNSQNRAHTDRIIFVTFDELQTDIYQELLPQYFPPVANQQRRDRIRDQPENE
jgi:O-acetyl-ADP-ribose deacetylase (regulator of RNase III)